MNVLTKGLFALQVAATCTVLAACGTVGEPKVKAVQVLTPIREACVPKGTPAAPASYPDDGALDPSVAPSERYRRIYAADEARKARLALTEPIIAGCR